MQLNNGALNLMMRLSCAVSSLVNYTMVLCISFYMNCPVVYGLFNKILVSRLYLLINGSDN